MTLTLRPLIKEDCDLLQVWRNDPFIVSRSASRKTVNIIEHRAWFERLLADQDSIAFMVQLNGIEIGHLRLNRIAVDECLMTIYLLEAYTGHGHGIAAIRLGCERARKIWPKTKVRAEVRADNTAGQIAFKKAGFQESQSTANHSNEIVVFHHSLLVDEEGHTKNSYGRLFEQFGNSHRTLNWGSETSQALRFMVLSEIGELAGHSVLDVGCGLGDFASWLSLHKLDVDYVGVDLTEELVDEARKRHPNRRFMNGSISDPLLFGETKFDYVVASGIFATYSTTGDEWMKQTIIRMWELTRLGLAFNSLSSWAIDPDPDEYHADPIKTIDFCKQLTQQIRFRHDYHPRDFTLFLLRRM